MNIDQSALPTIMAVLKLLEYHAARSRGQGDFQRNIRGSKSPNKLIKQVLSELDSSSIDILKKILVSMALMTNGNVDTVRDPSKFNEKKAESLESAMSIFVEEVFMAAGGDIKRLATKEDYSLAKNILPIISKVKMDRGKLVSLLKGDYKIPSTDGTLLNPGRRQVDVSKDLKVADVLYRGLHSMSYKTIIFLLFNPNPSWDVSRAVSTSEVKGISLQFAKKGTTGWGIFFHIANADGQGFHVGDMSWFGNEKEYLLAGKLQVKAVSIKLRCYREVKGELLWSTWFIKSKGGEVTIDTGKETLSGKEASNLILKIMFTEEGGLKSFEHNDEEWTYKDGTEMAEVFCVVDPEKTKEPLDEMSSMGGGSVQGYGAPLGTPEDNEAFNKKEEREQRLKGPRLVEMYSSRGITGLSRAKNVSAEEEHAGHVERSKHQGLRNVTESDDMETDTMAQVERAPEEVTTVGMVSNQLRKRFGNEVMNSIESKGVEVEGELGSGMFGVVLKVDYFDDKVALKIVADGPKFNGVDWKEREMRNYKIIGKARGSNPLLSKHFPKVIDVWEAGGYGLILMELLEPITNMSDVFIPDKSHLISRKSPANVVRTSDRSEYVDQSKKAEVYFRSEFLEFLAGFGDRLVNHFNKKYKPVGTPSEHFDLQIEISPTNIAALERLYTTNRPYFEEKFKTHYDYLMGMRQNFRKTTDILYITREETTGAPYLVLAMAIIAHVAMQIAFANDPDSEAQFVDLDISDILATFVRGYREFSAFKTGYKERQIGKDKGFLSGEWNETFKALHDATNLTPKDMHYNNVMQRSNGDLVVVDLGLFREEAEKGFKFKFESRKYKVKLLRNPRKNGII
jgi:hypothetical protein